MLDRLRRQTCPDPLRHFAWCLIRAEVQFTLVLHSALLRSARLQRALFLRRLFLKIIFSHDDVVQNISGIHDDNKFISLGRAYAGHGHRFGSHQHGLAGGQ